MTKEQREKMLASIRKFTLMDDMFFHTCLKDDKRGMQYILRIILKKPELVVLEMHMQEAVPSIYGRSVTFDVFVRDAGGREYNVEVQQKNDGADPRRARYHASLLDTMNVERRAEWKDLPPTIVIFITAHDVMKAGKPIYHVVRVVKELDHKRFEDESEIIYVNATIQDDTPLGQLMQDFACADPAKMHSKILAERVKYFKTNEHGVRTMCNVMEEFTKDIREEGKAEGIAEKTMRTILNQLRRHADYAIIASDNETSVDEVMRIAKENGLAY